MWQSNYAVMAMLGQLHHHRRQDEGCFTLLIAQVMTGSFSTNHHLSDHTIRFSIIYGYQYMLQGSSMLPTHGVGQSCIVDAIQLMLHMPCVTNLTNRETA